MGGGQLPTRDRADAIGEEPERTLPGNLGIELADTARRAIPGIEERSFAARGGFFVVAGEIVAPHVDFAAHFQY